MSDELLIQRICDIITGNNFCNSELDGLALQIGHQQEILNPPVADLMIEYWTANCIAVVSPDNINDDGEHQILGIAKVEDARIYFIEIDSHCPPSIVDRVRQICIRFIVSRW